MVRLYTKTGSVIEQKVLQNHVQEQEVLQIYVPEQIVLQYNVSDEEVLQKNSLAKFFLHNSNIVYKENQFYNIFTQPENKANRI